MQSTRPQGQSAHDPDVTVADQPAGQDVPFAQGEILGRYVVLKQLGRGGMGVVLEAYDTKLDRRVALKLLHTAASRSPENHTRLLREAQALAKLSHPSVVSVYDVGELRGQVFIAMEFVDGPNLRAWLRERRSLGDILEVFRDAARGLQAAHDVGIVHRDFKPDNVLIGSDGRARVTDFGLALDDLHRRSHPVASTSGDGRLTEVGMVMGTPAYMPVEQHRGQTTDARTDQFSFCVALFEAVYGVRPFSGANANEYCASIERGEVSKRKAPVHVPRRIHRAVMRGLRAQPDARHPSMGALLRALAPRRRQWRTWVFTGGLGLALGAGAVALVDEVDRPCAAFDDRISEAYGEDDKRRILVAFTTTALPEAQASFDAVTGALSDYATRWVDTARDACLASERGAQSDHVLDLRMACLERARTRLATTVRALQHPDANTVRRGVEIASAQNELALCNDVEMLDRSFVPAATAKDAATAVSLLQALDEIDAMRAAGRHADAKLLFAEHRARFEALDHPPVSGRALLTRARLFGTDNDIDHALPLLHRAHLLALEHGLDSIAAEASREVAFQLAHLRSDYDAAAEHLTLAMALAKASGSRRTEANVHGAISQLRFRQSRFDEALAAADAALTLERSSPSPNPLFIAGRMRDRAFALLHRDGPHTGLDPLRTTHAYISEHLGPTHPLVINVESTLAGAETQLGNHEAAFEYSESAAALARDIHGPGSLDEAYALVNHCSTLNQIGRAADALVLLERTQAVFAQHLGPSHPTRLAVLNNIAASHVQLENWGAAVETLNRALRASQSQSTEATDVSALIHQNIAKLQLQQGDMDGARQSAERAFTHSRAVFGHKHEVFVELQILRGRIELHAGAHATAREYFDRATELETATDAHRAHLDYLRARARIDDPETPSPAVRQALEQARIAAAALTTHATTRGPAEEAKAWLAKVEKRVER